MDDDVEPEDGPPDIDAMVAEVAAAIDAAFRGGPNGVRTQMQAAIARGERGYIPVTRPPEDREERRVKSWEQIAPLLASQANELHDKVASLGETLEEQNLLRATEHRLRQDRPNAADSGNA